MIFLFYRRLLDTPTCRCERRCLRVPVANTLNELVDSSTGIFGLVTMTYTSVVREENSFGPLRQVKSTQGYLIWDFTLLFEDAILVSGPLALGVLVLLIELAHKLRRRPARTIRLYHSTLGWTKLVCVGFQDC